jgi:glycosyltransferase involved in cell wall biosynthesis
MWNDDDSAARGGGVTLSIVIPVYDEVENVQLLYRAVKESVNVLGRSYEIIFVDDGSRDLTLGKLIAIQEADDTVRVIKLRKNFGQTAAMRVGIQAARGSLIVTMDGDLQNDARDIPQLLDEIERGHDLVIGWRRDRRDPLISRTLPSRVANRLISRITGVAVHDSGCSLKAYRGEMIKRVPLYSEMHRFIPAMSTVRGARIGEVVVRHHPRTRGRSKYGISRVGKVLLDVIATKMLITFSQRPMHWFSALAIPFWCAALIAGLAYAVVRFGTSGQSSLLVSPIAFLLFSYLTVHFLLIGLIAELIVRSGRIRRGMPRATIEHVNSQST